MKLPPEVKTAISFKKEYDMLMRYANLAIVPIEKKYYQDMAYRTSRYIDWELLKPKKKVEENYEVQ